MTVEKLKVGDEFQRKPGAKKTYIRGKYCPTNRKYECTNYEDINDFIYLKKGTQIFGE